LRSARLFTDGSEVRKETMPSPTMAAITMGTPADLSFAAMFTGRTATSYSPEITLAAIRSALGTATIWMEAPATCGAESNNLIIPMPEGPLSAANCIFCGPAACAERERARTESRAIDAKDLNKERCIRLILHGDYSLFAILFPCHQLYLADDLRHLRRTRSRRFHAA